MPTNQQTSSQGYPRRIQFDSSYLWTPTAIVQICLWLLFSTTTIFFANGSSAIIENHPILANGSIVSAGTSFYWLLRAFLLFRFLISICYMIHVVGVYDSIPWYMIQIILDGVGVVISTICAIFSILIWAKMAEYSKDDTPYWSINISVFLSFGLATLCFFDLWTTFKRKRSEPQG